MFIPKVWFEDNMLWYDNHPWFDDDIKQGWINIETPIIKVWQHETTVYVKGETRNVIVVNVGLGEQTRVFHEYSHEIPTWMKEDFNRFLKE